MKNTSTKNSKAITVSLKDFNKYMLNGLIGHKISVRTANTYISHMRKVISIYDESSEDFFKLTPTDFLVLKDLIKEKQEKDTFINPATYRAITSATRCYMNYLNLKYSEIKVERIKVFNVRPIKIRDNKQCKSLLWKILNAFGLLKYI